MERAARPFLALVFSLFLLPNFQVPDLHAQKTRVLTGTVIDAETGQRVPNAQVGIPGLGIGTLTTDDGTFRLSGVPNEPFTLQVQSLGYRTTERAVPPSEDTVEITLGYDYLQLEEIVVTGRATSVERRNAAISVATVSAAEIQRVPVASVEKTLQGR